MAGLSDLSSRLIEHEEEERNGACTEGSSENIDAWTQDGSIDWQGLPASRAKTGGWKTSPYILGTECCERLAFYGINTNLVIYLTKMYHQGNAPAARDVAVWAGTGYLTPILGAFIADSFLGRYKTIRAFSTIYLIGLFLLTISSATFTPPPCTKSSGCPKATFPQSFALYAALYSIALGMGGIKSCVSAFGADQFDDYNRSERKRKSHFFNWFYMAVNFGAFIATTVLVYVQDNVSWPIGFGIPVVAMVVALSCFVCGARYYRHQKPGGSPLTRIAQVVIAATRKWKLKVPKNETFLYGFHDEESGIEGSRKIEHTVDFRFLDKAAVEDEHDESLTPWRLCTVAQVEEVKQVVRLMPIWATNIFFSTCFAQLFGLFIVQGARMDNRVSSLYNIPPASMSVFELITVLLLVPLYDRVIIKFVRKRTGHLHGFTQLQRMGIGLVLGTIAMVSAALVETQRLRAAKHSQMLDDPISRVPMSIFWQVPQFVLMGTAETFTYVGQLEFFYQEAPDSMRSLGTAMALATYGIGYYVNSIMITLISKFTRAGSNPGWIPDNLNRGHVDYYFWTTAALSLVNFGLYLWCARKYKHREILREDEQ